MMRTVNIMVNGKVQGVCFRAATLKQAQKLRITGWVRNLTSGEVEIHAQGESSAIDQLIRWSHKGSLFAKVAAVNITELIDSEAFSDFQIR